MRLRLESPPTTIKNGTAWPKKLPSVAHVGTEDNLLSEVRMEEEADHLVVYERQIQSWTQYKGLAHERSQRPQYSAILPPTAFKELARKGTLIPFLESPNNLTGPKKWFKIKIFRDAGSDTLKNLFCFFNWWFYYRSFKNFWNSHLEEKQNSFTSLLSYRNFRETTPWAVPSRSHYAVSQRKLLRSKIRINIFTQHHTPVHRTFCTGAILTPLTPKSDWLLFSPIIIPPKTNIEVTRIKEMINT